MPFPFFLFPAVLFIFTYLLFSSFPHALCFSLLLLPALFPFLLRFSLFFFSMHFSSFFPLSSVFVAFCYDSRWHQSTVFITFSEDIFFGPVTDSGQRSLSVISKPIFLPCKQWTLIQKSFSFWVLNSSWPCSSAHIEILSINPLNAELKPICHLLILLGDLTFMVPCILSIIQHISNKMQRYAVYLHLETALHVSGGTSTHHQERIQLYLQHLVFVTTLLTYATHSTLKPVPTLPR
jgi:hypothetical protein